MAIVLIVDDDPLMRRMVARILAGAAHQVYEAGDGDEGLEAFRAHEPAIVITDILMPNKEGIETIKEMRRARPSVRILAMSGGGSQVDMSYLDMAQKLGADDILAKPFRADDLLQKIAALEAQ